MMTKNFTKAEMWRKEPYTLQLIGIGSKGRTTSNTLYNKYRDEDDSNKLITINSEIDDISINSKSKVADILAVITELDNQIFYKNSIQIAEQYPKTLLSVCVTSSTPDSYNSEELKKYYDIIIHTDSSTVSMYRPIEMMACELTTGFIGGTGFEDILFIPHHTRVMFHIEKTYSDSNDAIKNINQLKNTISKNVNLSSTFCIIIIHEPDEDNILSPIVEITEEFIDMMGYKSTSNYRVQAHLYDDPDIKNIKVSILYGESIKDSEENSDTI